ncbi:MAG: histidine phosphatase family protein [Burkholderiaceae bacterium]
MHLILWRHAEAVPEQPGQPDLERALTPQGERQAQRMALWLNRHLRDSTHIVASPARRCQQTARALDREFRTVEEIGPGADPQTLLRAARWPEGTEPVLLIGHQPTLGLAASLLLTGAAQPWTIKKGAVWWFRQRDGKGEGEGAVEVVLQAVRAPDGL